MRPIYQVTYSQKTNKFEFVEQLPDNMNPKVQTELKAAFNQISDHKGFKLLSQTRPTIIILSILVFSMICLLASSIACLLTSTLNSITLESPALNQTNSTNMTNATVQFSNITNNQINQNEASDNNTLSSRMTQQLIFNKDQQIDQNQLFKRFFFLNKEIKNPLRVQKEDKAEGRVLEEKQAVYYSYSISRVALALLITSIIVLVLTFMTMIVYEYGKRKLYMELLQFEYQTLFKFTLEHGKLVSIKPVHERVNLLKFFGLFFIFKFKYCVEFSEAIFQIEPQGSDQPYGNQEEVLMQEEIEVGQSLDKKQNKLF